MDLLELFVGILVGCTLILISTKFIESGNVGYIFAGGAAALCGACIIFNSIAMYRAINKAEV
jgi:hypothetical protein